MSILDNLKKKLTPELVSQIIDGVGDDFDWDMVPRTRLNKVIGERNALREQVASSTSDEDDVSKASGQPDKQKSESAKSKPLTQADIDAAVNAAKAEFDAERAKDKLQLAVTEKLRDAKVKRPELLLGQLKMDVVKFDDKGQLTGLDDQLATWKTSDPYLFGDLGSTPGTGAQGKGAGTTDLASLQTQYATALSSGNTATAVALKKQIFEMQQTK